MCDVQLRRRREGLAAAATNSKTSESPPGAQNGRGEASLSSKAVTDPRHGEAGS